MNTPLQSQEDKKTMDVNTNLLLQDLQKLLCDCLERIPISKWSFKGTVKYPDIKSLKYEFTYNNVEKDEKVHFCGVGQLTDMDTLDIENITCDCILQLTPESDNIAFSFSYSKSNLNDYTSIFTKIDETISKSRSYAYFLDDYKRYTHTDVIEYLKDLDESQFLEWKEEIIEDEPFGEVYIYTSSFGEDSYELAIVDVEYTQEEYDDGIFEDEDSLTITVAERFILVFSEMNSVTLRNFSKYCKKRIISIEDFLIRSTSLTCIHKNHTLQRIKALLCVQNNSQITQVSAEASYCEECDKYFISEVEFNRITRLGMICCKVITEAEFKKSSSNMDDSRWANESLLRSYGYNVNSKDNLSDRERQERLSFIIENEIVSVEKAIDFIEWLVGRNTTVTFENARNKWRRDVEFLMNYKKVNSTVRVGMIYRKKYIYK